MFSLSLPCIIHLKSMMTTSINEAAERRSEKMTFSRNIFVVGFSFSSAWFYISAVL
jgi:hypothetical protein